MAQSDELILLNGRVQPLGGHAPVEAAFVRDGRVVALGTESEIRTLAPGAETLDLEGGTATPGFTDAHVHWTEWAMGRTRVNVALDTMGEALEIVRAAAGNGGGWLVGRGWDTHLWGGFPTAAALDTVVPDRPVLLESRDMHAAWLNSRGLREMGITAATPDPEGGEVVRDPATGEPTGVVLERAREMVMARLPVAGLPEILDALESAQAEAHRLGLTGLHSVEPDGLDHAEALRQEGRLRLRLLQHIPVFKLEEAVRLGLRSGFGGDWIRIGGVKLFLDGTLGSCTAWLREPYEGTSDHGIQTLSAEDFRDAASRAAAGGLALTIHAIGDAAVELALDVLSTTPRPRALPHRIEHIQLCPPDLWERAGRSGVVGSVQPCHLLTDVEPAELHWGYGRSRGAYPFAALQSAGMTLAFGSDAPVESIDPRLSLYAACARPSPPDVGGAWHPEHLMTPAEAVAAFTEGPAAAAGLEHRQGRLLPGYDADFTVWDRDPLVSEPEEIGGIRCRATVVGGRIVFRA